MVEFKVSEDESYFFIKTTGDYPLVIMHTIKRPGSARPVQVSKGLLDIYQLPYRESAHQVQISKGCVLKLKEFIISKTGFIRAGQVIKAGMPPYYIEECKDGDTLYHFKLEVKELTEETEAITIYWIDETIDHVEIDLVAIPELIKFINENF